MKKRKCIRIGRWAVILFLFATMILACSGINKDVIKKQREGVIYQISYPKAFQCAMVALTQKGIIIDKIDREIGFITSRPRQIREERYVYQIIIRPIEKTITSISVICNWSISPGLDIAFAGIPSAIAKSTSQKLEIELAQGISEEIMKIQPEKHPISHL